jgi:mono/diheme cytochrome c family protein
MSALRATFGIVLGAWTLLVASACATARRGEPLAPPLAFSDPQAAHGQRVFYAQCHYCHPHGEGGLGPALNNKRLPAFLLRFQVRHGLGAMPAIGPDKVSPTDLDALVVYLKALRRSPAGTAR